MTKTRGAGEDMRIVFTDQYANLLLLVNGLAIVFYFAAKKKKKQRAMKFGNYETLQKVAGKNFLKSSNIVLLTRLLALTALIVGISDPALVEEKASTNSDYVLAIDSSSSMLSSDLEPTRFRAAKDVSKEFVRRLSNDTRVGIVTFGGEARKASEPGSNQGNTIRAIENLETSSTAGTAIGDALYTSAGMILDSNRSRRIVLVTDGRNNVGSPLNESVEFAKTHNASITAIGIGEGEEINEGFETVEGVNASRAEYPNIDSGRLEWVANQTGGEFLTVTNTTGLERAVLDFEQTEVRTDVSIYFLLLALGLILLEWVLGVTRYSILP